MSAAKKTMFSVLGLTLSLLFQGSMSYAEKIEAVIEGKEVLLQGMPTTLSSCTTLPVLWIVCIATQL